MYVHATSNVMHIAQHRGSAGCADRSIAMPTWQHRGAAVTCAFRSRPPVLPPKMGDGHEGSSAGADQFSAFFSVFFSADFEGDFCSATAANRATLGATDRTGARTAWPAKLLRWAVHERWASCIWLSMVLAIAQVDEGSEVARVAVAAVRRPR